MRLRKLRFIRSTAMVILLAALVWFGAGCQLLDSSQQQESGNMIKVEVHFTGGSQPLPGYVKSLKLEENGEFFQGGSSTIPIYDEQGNVKAVVNYGRVEYFKILP